MRKETIALGSGKLYIKEFTGELPDDTTIESELNLLGLIQGGASVSYKPSFYQCSDDLGLATKKFMTQEEVIFKSGIMTWNGKTLEKLCSTARVTEGTPENSRLVKIGGVTHYNGKRYVLHFVHKDPIDGDIRVTIVGSNEAGFELAFAKDKETVINAEFKATPQDNEGTLILYKETVKGE